jgi:hypothetical protein
LVSLAACLRSLREEEGLAGPSRWGLFAVFLFQFDAGRTRFAFRLFQHQTIAWHATESEFKKAPVD